MTVCGTGEQDSFWLNTDCCGLICACTTYTLLLFAEYAMLFVILDPWFVEADISLPGSENVKEGESGSVSIGYNKGTFHAVAFSTIVALAILSHLKAMTTDPGAVPRDARPLDHSDTLENANKKNYRMCLKCNSFKPGRTHHCSICRRCVVKMDHHCPWVNNCVGLGNHKFFLLFLMYVFTASIYALTIIFTRFLKCSSPGPKLRGHRQHNITMKPGCENTLGGSMIIFAIVTEALLFGLFTMCMMCDQWSVVLSAMTQIDRLKGERVRKRSLCENLTEVFGGEPRFSIFWILPVPVRFLDHERTYGYRRASNDVVNIDGIGMTNEVELVIQGSGSGLGNGNGSRVVDLSTEDGGLAINSPTKTQKGKKYNLVPS